MGDQQNCTDVGDNEKKKEDWIPYTYLLVHKISGLKYYGVRFAKGCHPNELWKTYWSSSKTVKQLIRTDGPDSFEISIRKTFINAELARKWENKVLRRLNVVKNTNFLNKTDNISIAPLYGSDNPATRAEVREQISKSIKERAKQFPNPRIGTITSQNVREKQSIAKQGALNPFYGKTHSDETKKILSTRQQGSKNSFYGKSHSDTAREKIGKVHRGVKKPQICCPHCGKLGAPNVMYRWHFEHCKNKYHEETDLNYEN